MVESQHEGGILFRIDDIPHFGFTVGIMTFFCRLVIRVYLDGQIVIRVNIFN